MVTISGTQASKPARLLTPPPASRRLSQSGRVSRPLRSSLTISRSGDPTATVALDWSTSYQASASSSASAGFYEDESLDEAEDSDPDVVVVRGRAPEPAPKPAPAAQPTSSGVRGGAASKPLSRQSTITHNGTVGTSNAKSPFAFDSATLTRRGRPQRSAASRSRSPKPPPTPSSPPARPPSPVALLRPSTGPSKQPPAPKPPQVALLPTAFRLHLNMPFTRLAIEGVIDARTTGEALLLLGGFYIVASRLRDLTDEVWVLLELQVLVALSLLYVIASHIVSMLSAARNIYSNHVTVPPIQLSRRSDTSRRLSVQTISGQVKTSGMAMLWMTDAKNYRECSDDGVLSAALFGPLVAAACLYSTARRLQSLESILPPMWRIEEPATLPPRADGSPSPPPLLALLYSRRALLQLTTLCSAIVLVHNGASAWNEWHHATASTDDNPPSAANPRLPKHEGRRTYQYSKFAIVLSVAATALKVVFDQLGVPIWKDLSILDVGLISLFHQFALYVMVRLARRGFTLGELGMVGQIATGMFMETFNLTVARIWPITTPYIKSFLLPTPLAVFQVALIPGTFLTGFLLSPLLVLSRHIAQRPVRRLRFPQERAIHRRALAGGFYAGAALIVGGLIGMWTRWMLGNRDPWLWALWWLVEGKRPWSRPALLAYWGLLGSVSVAGWNRQLARVRKYRHLSAREQGSESTQHAHGPAAPEGKDDTGNGPVIEKKAAEPTPADKAVSAATDLLDAADKRVPTLGLNARRKFFHALAVVMFVPGIAFDPAFTHLSFSAAFSLFTFAEYVRYFALYPFGAAVHVFLNEFLDHKDSGTAILSHFYLLTGCAVTLWLEGSSRILEFTGVLSLGVGDAMASIVGKRLGRRRWSAASGKTLEGTVAFVVSVVLCGLALRALGLVEGFSMWRYAGVALAGGLLEALSVQNDNLTLPLFMCRGANDAPALCVRPFDPCTRHAFCTRPPPTPGRMRAAEDSEAQASASDSPSSPPNALQRTQRPNTAPGDSSVPAFAAARDDQLAFPPAPRDEEDDSPPLRIAHAMASVPDLTSLPQRRVLPLAGVASAPAGWAGGVWPSSGQWSEREYDWPSFIDAYASGHWDPHHIPLQPMPGVAASFPFPPVPKSSSRSAAPSPDPDTTKLGNKPAASHALRDHADNVRAGQVHTGSSTGSGPSSSDQWSKLSSNTTPSSAASVSVPILARTDLQSPLGLAERRGALAPDLSHSMPARAPMRSAGGSDSPFSPYPLGRPRLKASSSSPGIVMEPEPSTQPQDHDPEAVSNRVAVAATMRWAGAGVSIAPLALPSPEHELTDPMRNYNRSLPPPTPREERGGDQSPAASRKRAISSASSATSDKVSKLRERGFWEGTQEVSPDMLPPIPGSTQGTPDPNAEARLLPSETLPRSPRPLGTVKKRTSKSSLRSERDYFSLVPPPPPRRPQQTQQPDDKERSSGAEDSAAEGSAEMSESGRSSPSLSVYETPAPWETPAPGGAGGVRPTAGLGPSKGRHAFHGMVPMSALKLPGLPTIPSPDAPETSRPESSRTGTGLTTSDIGRGASDDSDPTVAATSPDPTPIPLARPSVGHRSRTHVGPGLRVSSMALEDEEARSWRALSSPLPPTGVKSSEPGVPMEEVAFLERGFLPAPNPPNEILRLRALYMYNIMHTGPDMNFERLVHLAKLVFNTKIVMISLLDATEQWCKSSSGMEMLSTPREWSFCAHAILQRDEEPLVVLDAQEDWRFASNPLVAQPPHIRFYAGAPLRTQDGFNIGTLSIADDQPRTEFSPRQRHTLKEFAGVVMREVELWKDKIQLRIRDRIQTSMEQFTRECLEIDTESARDPRQTSIQSGSMDKIYDRAVKLVKRTLDVEGVLVMDVSHAEAADIVPPQDLSAASQMSLVLHSAEQGLGTSTKALAVTEYARITDFFYKHPDGKVVDGLVPNAFRGLIPSNIKYALIVPVFDVDKRPFALLCAYNSTQGEKPFLEGHELSYLRAIGVIILSAVLKRRMMLADKAKSLFISNISHELRTPLHGILAAAELLQDTALDQHQASILQTVQACGTSLVETVNHVLDFTKLSGSTKAGGAENAIARTRVDLMQLVEEAVEGCWIGYRARASALGESDIGSVYSPPKRSSPRETTQRKSQHVETVVDVDFRAEGWTVKCEKGGIRRVLMNLIGNSLKFTTDGSVHIVLRELHGGCSTPGKIRIELGVLDSGKGISKEFLKNQLFHPFSQENPLQTGTGLGLAIVNSIIHSKSVDGSVDVWSSEGLGTEIRVAMDVELVHDAIPEVEGDPWARHNDGKPISVTFVGFNRSLRGETLLLSTLQTYLRKWWGFEVLADDGTEGDILLVNEDPQVIQKLLNDNAIAQPVVVLSSFRGDSTLVNTVNAYEEAGGFCRIVYKPGGPSRLRNVLKLCVDTINHPPHESPDEPTPLRLPMDQLHVSTSSLMRRRSDEVTRSTPRPQLHTRSSTFHPNRTTGLPLLSSGQIRPSPRSSPTQSSTVPLPAETPAPPPKKPPGSGLRVLIIEDNRVLRDLLVQWAKTKGYQHSEAFDGLEGVQQFESNPAGTFDIILLDVSMPNMDGIAATKKIREIEARRKAEDVASPLSSHMTIIVALTGMSSSDDRTRAYQAGVNGYLIKPVSFKFLDNVLRELRESAAAAGSQTPQVPQLASPALP
ncbi:hypothetical protein EXIGLDRAFT_832857 [Exidia glandulosa HHB12029]|uniref:dolichol kinase n=1 Tax=Exidia glandulosa HHB12029 TaxID=1314781 RepID=A0A165L738_EXIGL|nr:hypothetical protein EXIGLDRAFT_832857 [Exidia glandulosa HHB12029]